MNDLIKYGWIKAEFNTIYKRKFHRISTLMRIFKSQEIDNFEYVLIDEYFIDKNNSLYFKKIKIYFNFYDYDQFYFVKVLNFLIASLLKKVQLLY